MLHPAPLTPRVVSVPPRRALALPPPHDRTSPRGSVEIVAEVYTGDTLTHYHCHTLTENRLHRVPIAYLRDPTTTHDNIIPFPGGRARA